ncbi:MAG: glycosyl transferase family 2 [Halobacteriovoraceae bacterium]|nr:glycosyl transferase family 2 [Peredibacter sp.]MBJ01071.1 glycosyl transferase family 2 [Halobacteriovoraceae bacterium]|tara:strand:+ start:7653 stop:8798 length:1146 start_codon:yes stop_codon:yes gene_type:complete
MEQVSVFLFCLIIYTYFGYMALAILIGFVRRKRVDKKEISPTVTLMIAAYNEEKSIEAKLHNCMELDYPKEKLQVVVVSDSSSDNTDSLVSAFPSERVKLMRVEGRVGKTEARNQAMREVKSEIVVFSDATTIYDPKVLRKFVQNFADPEVGMVTGHLKYVDKMKTQVGAGQKLFWKYETLLKKAQTYSGTLTGSVGCASAFRTELYTPLPSNVIEDFTEPLMIIKKGKRVVFEPEAICMEETTDKSSDEWNMRVRVVRGGLTGLYFAKELLNPFKYPFVSFQLVSHKLLRWYAPIIAIFLFLSCWLEVAFYRESTFVFLVFSLQLLFYIMALCASLLETTGVRHKLFSFAHYFFIVNAAALSAIYHSFFSELESTWEPKR